MRDLFSRSLDRSRSFSLSFLSRSLSLLFFHLEGDVDPANVDAAAVEMNKTASDIHKHLKLESEIMINVFKLKNNDSNQNKV